MNLNLRIVHGGSKSKILDLYIRDDIAEGIVVVDLDNPNDWPNRWRFILNNRMEISGLKSTYVHVNHNRKVLTLILEKNLEGWLIENVL